MDFPKQIVETMMSKDAFSQWLGVKVLHVEKGQCTLSMTIRKDMVNGFGIAHGGIAYSLADSALAFASNSHGRKSLSIETSISHTIPLKTGDEVLAVAEEDSLTNKIGIYRVVVSKVDGPVVALFKGTVYRTRDEW